MIPVATVGKTLVAKCGKSIVDFVKLSVNTTFNRAMEYHTLNFV
jgi:hypothetical protein